MRNPGSTGVVITMAGAGSRFTAAGYTIPKYEILARGRTLFAWSMESLRSFIDAGCEFFFVARNHPNIAAFLQKETRDLGIRNHHLITVNALTDGQATTALLASREWEDDSRPVAIYNIDTYVDPAAMDVKDVRGAGWLPCFPGEGDKWSFAAADENGLVSEVREKKRISQHATVGLYWFDSFQRYADAYQRYYANPVNLEAKERYIAPLYNQLIQDGADVFVQRVGADQVFPLGTPEDVDFFRQREIPALARTGAI